MILETEENKFNLMRALEGDPIMTREGKKVIKIAYFPNINEYSHIVYQIEKNDHLNFCNINGRTNNFLDEGRLDLFMDLSKTKYYYFMILHTVSNKLICLALKEKDKDKYYLPKKCILIDTFEDIIEDGNKCEWEYLEDYEYHEYEDGNYDNFINKIFCS